jgi:hypothetical protein
LKNEKEKKIDALANIDINNIASKFMAKWQFEVCLWD